MNSAAAHQVRMIWVLLLSGPGISKMLQCSVPLSGTLEPEAPCSDPKPTVKFSLECSPPSKGAVLPLRYCYSSLFFAALISSGVVLWAELCTHPPNPYVEVLTRTPRTSEHDSVCSLKKMGAFKQVTKSEGSHWGGP